MQGIATQSKTTPILYPNIGAFTFEVDYQGYITYFNGSLAYTSNGFFKQIIGRHIKKQFYAYPQLIQAIKQSFKDKVPPYQLKIRNQYLEFQFHIQANKRVWCIATDITENILKEQQLNAKIQSLEHYSKDLERFAYIASHDLHEPLRMVRSFLGLLEDEYAPDLEEEAQIYINYAVDGARRMQQLLDDLLSYNRLGKPNLSLKAIDISKVVDYQIHLLQKLVIEKNATIKIGHLPTTILANTKQINLLFYHLIQNALHFNDKPNPNIRITCEEHEPEWLFSVTDNGRGISKKVSSKIFDMFYKYNSISSKSTGIGLAICKKVIERLGGTIWVTSTLGEGTTFHFTIPK